VNLTAPLTPQTQTSQFPQPSCTPRLFIWKPRTKITGHVNLRTSQWPTSSHRCRTRWTWYAQRASYDDILADVFQLLNIMKTQLLQIRTRAPPSVPEGQQKLSSFQEKETADKSENATQNPAQPTQTSIAPPPLPTKEEFNEDLKDMAKDLVIKSQQIELLIANLPGVNTSEVEQAQRMKELEKELEDLEGERLQAVKEKEALLKMVEDKIMGVGRAR
jgi:mediator of RNA polymerase II transcription subunit 21